METLFIIASVILFIAWIGGLLASTDGFWNHFIGDTEMKNRLKKPLHFKRRISH